MSRTLRTGLAPDDARTPATEQKYVVHAGCIYLDRDWLSQRSAVQRGAASRGGTPAMHVIERRRTLMNATASSVVIAALLSIASCSSSSSDGVSGSSGTNGTTSGSTCATAGARMCERACSCAASGDATCKTAHEGKSGGATVFTWDSVDDCKAGYVDLACKDGGPPGVDFAACESAVDAAACTDDAILIPKTCDPPKDSDGG